MDLSMYKSCSRSRFLLVTTSMSNVTIILLVTLFASTLMLSHSGSYLMRSPSSRGLFEGKIPETICLTVIVMGASGDLAKKKTYPALFQLHSKKFLPENVRIIGYARTQMTDEELRSRIRPYLKGSESDINEFLTTMSYISGQYDEPTGYQNLAEKIEEGEKECDQAPCGRLFYLALPPSVYPQVLALLKLHCTNLTNGDQLKSFLRIVIEKPFGHDFQSAESLSEKLGRLFNEDQLYRIDHYLGKELTQNLMVMRFENGFFEGWWNRQHISNVQITFKEDFGVEGRAGYFDQSGIIRDVIQNHLLQLMTLVAMEKPVSSHPDDIRDEKLKVLRCTQPVTVEDCVVGQYAGRGDHMGYLQDKDVPEDSTTPTFAACVLYVRNNRWADVPFILKAGKALNERKSEIRIQLKTPAAPLFVDNDRMRNELVIRLQPHEAIYMKMLVKSPGLDSNVVMSELDLSYGLRYKDVVIPDAYERLILDVVRGDQQHFVRRDELLAAWKIFDTLLEKVDNGDIRPETYNYGSRGPKSADDLLARVGYVPTDYTWKSQNDAV